jgi:FkbM family methyltransferase
MTKCRSDAFRASLGETYKRIERSGHMPGSQFQRDCLLSILAEVEREEFCFVELGAGWGRLCLELAGAIDFNMIPCRPRRYSCLAVEAEPVHYGWLKEHFEVQQISGTPVFGAVSDKTGTGHFDALSSSPDSEYGQAILPLRGRRGLPSLHSLRKILGGKAVRVPMYTLDRLAQLHGLERIDVVQMDVQGAEFDVIKGAAESIRTGIVDHFLINIHRDEYHREIPKILEDRYELVVNLQRGKLGAVQGFPPIDVNDGIQMYKRKANHASAP